eukprot:CAMPEP_0119525084 /NCGR_PEP_ID=MMETSP1344-20130328/39943_1 /TAXON_ID=236787 /ORGANISM="Florenciella parvula, Strain CCMP2471" /LENGTH=87 /DNA_ID=CAMNT_0007563765 /DNA_START=131 /DNA_END=390 /DNA_ORIENTATION=-
MRSIRCTPLVLALVCSIYGTSGADDSTLTASIGDDFDERLMPVISNGYCGAQIGQSSMFMSGLFVSTCTLEHDLPTSTVIFTSSLQV